MFLRSATCNALAHCKLTTQTVAPAASHVLAVRLSTGAMPSFSTADNISSGFAGTTPMAVEATSAQPQQSLRQQGPMPSSGFYPGPVVTSGQLGVPAQQQYQPANLTGLDVGQMGMPAIPIASAQNGIYTSGSPQQNGSGASDFSLDDEHLATDQHQRPGNSRRANGKLHARDTKTKRNPKQQMQNKQAQQRYRSTCHPMHWLAMVILCLPGA